MILKNLQSELIIIDGQAFKLFKPIPDEFNLVWWIPKNIFQNLIATNHEKVLDGTLNNNNNNLRFNFKSIKKVWDVKTIILEYE